MRRDGRSARWAGQQQRRRAEFVDAALVAIARHGPETSTEQIAQEAGVARTRLYKHFTDASDLDRAIAQRVAALITVELEPVWSPTGTPMQVIVRGVRTHLRWLTEHGNLYRYLSGRSLKAGPDSGGAITDIKTAIGHHLASLFTDYSLAFGLPTARAESMGFGIVGLVETASSRWLQDPTRLTQDELTEDLARWIWLMFDDVLHRGGVRIDPHQPITLPPITDHRAPSAADPGSTSASGRSG